MDHVELRNARLEQARQLLASSLTVKEWCRLNRVSESTMHNWLRVLRKEEGAEGRNGWIEVDRRAERSKVALAVRGGDADAPTDLAVAAACADGMAFPPIRVSANGIGVEVPHGACESDVAAVLRAAMSL